ncbi:glycosyltransferase [Alteromonas sp. 14N.309.X.WAT.G.H12]|uniref:glycosyltransferase n=1 Tax=Alteromonas sp. 14N.309.X.WAT.G.H12 TaxID=3120824 RepID=UPI002FD6C3EF
MNDVRKLRVLMIAFEFPPSNGASVQRILSVYRQYLDAGYAVDVLTAHPSAYDNVQPLAEGMLPENPDGQIMRVIALDAQNDLAIGGKHIGRLATPDRWSKTWVPLSTLRGFMYARRYKPDLIWSSSPTPSPHIIARRIQLMTGAKWIADYRDPMPHLHRETPNSLRPQLEKIDEMVSLNVDMYTFATPEVKALYAARYNSREVDLHVMPNGYDAALLSSVAREVDSNEMQSLLFPKGIFNIYYAGVLYSDGRDPVPLFHALAQFVKENPDKPVNLVFQGVKNASDYTEIIAKLKIEHMVKFEPGVTFKEALKNMYLSDALLLIQGAKFNRQIPGKVYEYLATGKSIFLMTPKDSATYSASMSHDGVYHADSQGGVYRRLCDLVLPFFEQANDGSASKSNNRHSGYWERNIAHHSRQHSTKKLIAWSAELLKK